MADIQQFQPRPAPFLSTLVLSTLVGFLAPTLQAETENTDQQKLNLEIALGSAAKRVCSSVFVSGRSVEHVRAEELERPDFAAIKFEVDSARVLASAGGMQVEAIYRDPLGCTLLKKDTPRVAIDLDKISPLPDYEDAEWPQGNKVVLPKSVPGVDLQAVNAAVDAAFEDMEPDQNIRTRAVLVIYKGKIIAEQYAEPFNADTAQLGWSMTKTVTGALTGMMAAEGMLDIKKPAPVSQWNGNDPRGEITLEDLLQMSSGLRFSEVYTSGSMSDVILMLYTTGDTGEFAIEQPLEHAPGSHWSYSSGTSNIIARIQKNQFADIHDYLNYARENLFSKLGMSSTVIEPDESGTYVGSSYMYATPRDWAKFGLLHLQDGVWNGERILPEGWVDYVTTPAEAAPEGEYGIQIWLNAGKDGKRSYPNLPESMYYLSGFEGQNVVMFPDQDLIVVRMGLTTKGPRPVWTLAEKVLAAIK
ncbi:serine hydrolase [Proteobacteria bacterium 005FR1]|nr:serine hydrolase [Proteobacteria bacterium 005FR1]